MLARLAQKAARSRLVPQAGATASCVPDQIIQRRIAANRRLARETRPSAVASAAARRKDQIGIIRIFSLSGRPITSAASIPIS